VTHVSVRIAIGGFVAITLLMLALLLAAHPPKAVAGDKDCDDFSSQKAAQKFFRKHNPRSDPHYLDADNDGIACEDNPCPCSSRLKLRTTIEEAIVGRFGGVDR
jgi:hypothetical protein